MAQILVGATIVGSIETVWAGTITPPREGIIKRWTWPAGENDGSVALLKGQEMGRFKLGSTVINLFAPGKVNLPKPLLRQTLNPPRFLLKRSKQNTTPAHWLTTKKTRSNPSKETLTCA